MNGRQLSIIGELFSVKRRVFEWESAYHCIWIWVLGPQVISFIFSTIEYSSLPYVMYTFIDALGMKVAILYHLHAFISTSLLSYPRP